MAEDSAAELERLRGLVKNLIDRCTFRNGFQFSMQKGFHPALHALWKEIYPEAHARAQAAQGK